MSATTALQSEVKSELSKLGWLILWIPPIVFIRAWTLTILWDWYIVPGFGAQSLDMIYAFGIMVIISFLTPSQKREDHGISRIVIMSIGGALMSLLFGWIGTFFI